MKTTAVFLNRHANTDSSIRPGQAVSFTEKGIEINIAGNDPYFFRKLQKAARSIDQTGIMHPKLESEWSFDEQWTFQMGYLRFQNPGSIHFAKLPAEEMSRFKALTKVWHWLRNAVNAGPSQLPPAELAKRAETLIQEFAGDQYTIKVEKIIGEDLHQRGFVGCYYVGRGSEFPPVLLSIKIYPKGQEQQKVEATMIGKGITFDSGGYIIKSKDGGISYMKADMGGAATVTAAMAFAMSEGIQKPVELVLACAENLVSSTAYRPGDVITYKNGLKVEIINTDAEGRVVLGDGFIKAQEEQPQFILDAATLTGAAKAAVGADYAALFSVDEKLRTRALTIAKDCNEGLWPLPFETWHQEAYPSLVADTLNADVVGSGFAGASSATGFLSRFVEPKQKWLHYDLASAYAVTPNSMWPGGATGLMVRSIAKMFREEVNAL